MNKFPPSISPFDLVASANAVGFIIASGDFTLDELNVISEWLMQVGQYISTYIAQQQLLDARNQEKKEESNSDSSYLTH